MKSTVINVEGQNNIKDLSFLNGYDLSSVEELNLNSTSLTSLKGIEQLQNLKILDLGGTAVTDITPLLALKSSLQDLCLINVRTSDTKTLGQLTKLQKLFLINNDGQGLISSIDDLSSLTDLTVLELSGNPKITSIEPLSSLTRLRQLDISGTGVTTIDVVTSMKQLNELTMIDVPLSAERLSPLTGLSSLQKLLVDSELKHTAEQILRSNQTQNVSYGFQPKS